MPRSTARSQGDDKLQLSTARCKAARHVATPCNSVTLATQYDTLQHSTTSVCARRAGYNRAERRRCACRHQNVCDCVATGCAALPMLPDVLCCDVLYSAATRCTLLRRVVLCFNVLCCAATCCTVRGRGGADHQHLEDLREQLVHLLDRRPPRRLDAEDAFKDGPFLVLRSTVPRDVARCNMSVQHVATACKVDLGPAASSRKTNFEEWARLRDFD